MLSINYKDKRPIYIQIKEGIKSLIISNAFLEDEKLPSVRELAVALTVNPNTIQRAYKDLEAENYIYSAAGKGNFVSKKKNFADKERTKELYSELEATVKEIAFSNEPIEKVIELINNIYNMEG